MIYLELFWSFFQVGLFSFGGGYAALPLIKARIVDVHGWLTLAEFTDVVTISQMTPGPIGINAATFVGARIAGISGSIAATAGCVAPSFIVVLTLAYLYNKYNKLEIIQIVLKWLRPAIVGLIAAAGLAIMLQAFLKDTATLYGLWNIDIFSVVLFAAGFLVLAKWKTSPVYIMLGSGLAGLIAYLIQLV